MNFETVAEFEKQIADFFGAPHAVAVDCCTHALELCFRHQGVDSIAVPTHTYISVPMLAKKLGLDLKWKEENWVDYYYLTENIIDAAVLWKPNSYISGTYMCVSFQFKKHLSLGRGGIILTDNEKSGEDFKKMSYDGRLPDVPWVKQNISTMGYHYYMTPETAALGIKKLAQAIKNKPRQWVISDWVDLREMDIFKEQENK